MKKLKEVTTEQVRAMLNSRKDMTGLNLKGFNFSGETLENIDFSQSKLKGVNFEGATIINCLFRDTNLKNASFKNTEIFNVEFHGKLNKVDYSNSKIINTTFKDSKLDKVLFKGAIIEKNDFRGTYLHYVNFEDCIFCKEVLFQNAIFSGDNAGIKIERISMENKTINYCLTLS